MGSRSDSYTRTEVRTSIIAGNTNTNVDSGETANPNTFESNGSNLIGDGNATGAFNKPGDQRGVSDPGLGVLANNGGPTKTHGLVVGSPAIDAVAAPAETASAAAVEEPCGVEEDQRGVSRPRDGDEDGTAKCDIGSFELKADEVVPPPRDPPPPKNSNACTIKGNNKDNVLRGTLRRDVICGLGGNDIIRGMGGNDVIYGGPGNDVLLGGSGKDVLNGGRGKDVERQG